MVLLHCNLIMACSRASAAAEGQAEGGYAYTQQLLELDACKPRHQPHVHPSLADIQTPVRLTAWQKGLANHPDQRFAKYVLQGLSEGFRVGFQYQTNQLQQSHRNMLITQPTVVGEYILNELEANRLAVLSPEEAIAAAIHCSPIGIIPKKNKPGKWRLIVDLSTPEKASVNDGIKKELCSLSYTSVDTIAEKIVTLGRGTLLAKIDIKQAYRIIPVHPEDRWLLGMSWEGRVYVDKTLPFGLRSAPLIFTAVADALAWLMKREGVSLVDHYLDDFITLGRPRSDECANNFQRMLETCEDAGTPVEAEKSESPTTKLTFLGIELDSAALEMRLPADKMANLRGMIASWRGKKACRKRDLLSLIGSLAHACKVIRPGRSFVRRLIDLSKKVTDLNHFVRLNAEARSDIEWWFRFAEGWNGVSMMYRMHHHNCSVNLLSDASGSWGCGAFCGKKWFHFQWPSSLQNSHITVKELVPIVVAAAIWGSEWAARNVMAICDNSAVVAILRSGDCKNPEVMHLMRCLAFLKAKFQFALFSSHIGGKRNDLADALSRNDSEYFFTHYPQANPKPTPLPPELLDLTIIQKPDWTSQHWTNLWCAIFRQDWLPPPNAPTTQQSEDS